MEGIWLLHYIWALLRKDNAVLLVLSLGVHLHHLIVIQRDSADRGLVSNQQRKANYYYPLASAQSLCGMNHPACISERQLEETASSTRIPDEWQLELRVVGCDKAHEKCAQLFP